MAYLRWVLRLSWKRERWERERIGWERVWREREMWRRRRKTKKKKDGAAVFKFVSVKRPVVRLPKESAPTKSNDKSFAINTDDRSSENMTNDASFPLYPNDRSFDTHERQTVWSHTRTTVRPSQTTRCLDPATERLVVRLFISQILFFIFKSIFT